MSYGRAGSVIASLLLHACALWWWKPQHDVPLAAGEPEGARVSVELVEAGPLVEAIPSEVTPPELIPHEAESPEPTPPEPEPAVEEPPSLPPLDAIEEHVPAPIEPPKPKPKPAPKVVSKPPPRPAAAIPSLPRAATAPAMAGKVSGVSAGSADGESRAREKHRAKPVYPDSLRGSGATARVEILVVVSAQGQPISARVYKSSGNPLFDQAALGAARASEFYPKKSLGVAVQDTVRIPYSFNAEN